MTRLKTRSLYDNSHAEIINHLQHYQPVLMACSTGWSMQAANGQASADPNETFRLKPKSRKPSRKEQTVNPKTEAAAGQTVAGWTPESCVPTRSVACQWVEGRPGKERPKG